MANPYRSIVATLAAKTGTLGAGFVTADVFDGYGWGFDPNFEKYKRQEVHGNMMKRAPINGARSCKFQVNVDLKAHQTVSTLPEWSQLMQLCGVDAAIVTTTCVFKPLVAVNTPGAIGVFADGVLLGITGALGTFKLSAKSGEPLHSAFEFTGAYRSVTTTAPPVLPTFDATNPLPLLGATFTLLDVLASDADPIEVRGFNFDLGNLVVLRESIRAPSGYIGAFIGDRTVTGNIDLEFPNLATLDLFLEAENTTEGLTEIAWGTGVEAMKILVNRSTFSDPKITNDNGRLMATVGVNAIATGADAEGDDFQIITGTP